MAHRLGRLSLPLHAAARTEFEACSPTSPSKPQPSISPSSRANSETHILRDYHAIPLVGICQNHRRPDTIVVTTDYHLPTAALIHCAATVDIPH